MNNSVSIIIPAYNAERTLKKCLDTVFASISLDDEVIVIDDSSTDSTAKIAKSFKCRIHSNLHNRGAGSARNEGAKMALNDILIFVDSDVLITRENVDNIKKYFESHSKVHSLTMNVKTEESGFGFFSDFKNLYMNFIISKSARSVNYIYGSFCATRKKGFINWPENLRLTEDSLWGYEQKSLGHEIHCLKDIEVNHIKSYSLISLIKNDFNISSHFARAFLESNRWNTLFTRESFGHTSKQQKLSVFLAVSCSMFFFYDSTTFAGLLILWMLINFKFFKFVNIKRGLFFTLLSIGWYFFAYHIYFLGIFHGSLKFLAGKSKAPEREIA